MFYWLGPLEGSLLNSSSREVLATPGRRTLGPSHHSMKCPYCGQEIGTSIADLADESFLLLTQCEKCGKAFLIVDGVPMTEERYSLHNPPRP
jgi:hypothetical protein